MRSRRLAIVVALLLFAAACGGGGTTTEQAPTGDETTDYGSGLLGEEQEGQPQGEQAGEAEQAAEPGAAGGGTPKKTTPKPVAGGDTSTPEPEMLRSGKAYLRGSVPKMVVEIVAVEGAQPTQEALNRFKQVIGGVIDKPGGIEIRLAKTIPREADRYSPERADALVAKHRATHTTRETASLFMLCLNGRDSRSPTIGGYAPRGAEHVVLFTEAMRQASGVSSPSKFEAALIIHEVGHLLGLLNIGYTSPREREDQEHPKHTKNPESVMYWAVENPDIVGQLFGAGPPDTFDADDKADLADLRAGRL